jgi:SAM-dependent methyltransferase
MNSEGAHDEVYANRAAEERRHYDSVAVFDDLPAIYHYWSHTYIRPMLEPLGCSRPAELFARYLLEGAKLCGADRPVFASVGSGDANNEIEVARLLKDAGLAEFTIECIEFNPALIERSIVAARDAGLAQHLTFLEQDFNVWQPARVYHGVIANQSLHHVSNLEGLFDTIRNALAPGGFFVASDIIGRNGHQRWPEARRVVERFWSELPAPYKHHRQLDRYEEQFQDWDCSAEGFEGIRSQDVLTLLIERFSFHAYIGFGSAIDPFVDRGFGPNFDAEAQWDRSFIDRVHAHDERGLLEGALTPTHMFAVMSLQPCENPYYARGLSPEASVRDAGRPASESAIDEHPAAELVVEPQLPLRGRARQIGIARGLQIDGWVGRSLEFTIAADEDVDQIRVHVTMPVGQTRSVLSIDVDGVSAGTSAMEPGVPLTAAMRVARGSTATIRITTAATVNHKRDGISDDERDLGFHLDEIFFEHVRGGHT